MADRNKTSVLITKYREHTVCARYIGFRMTDITVCRDDAEFKVGDIVIGKVTAVRPQIHAVFVSLGKGPDAYLSLDDPHDVIYTHGNGSTPIGAGDEILVQVIKEPHADKTASVSTNLMFAGHNVILMTGKPTLGISAKIPEAKKKELRHLISPLMPDGFGVIVRTAAQDAPLSEISEELNTLTADALQRLHDWKRRTCFSVVRQGTDDAAAFVQEHLNGEIDEILTDLPEQYDRMQVFLRKTQEASCVKLRFYDPDPLPLAKVYALETQIDKARAKKVWMKSGAYLYIEETQAMAVIDVNSGKALSAAKGRADEKRRSVLRVNAEAAKEIARQIRLRNLSGIIVTDFIDMDREEDRQEILQILKEETREDPCGVHVLDMTALQLCEMTRKRRKKPLSEQI